MYRLNVLQYQWLILALLSGIVLTLAIISTYLMMWRPRNPSGESITDGKALFKWIPWIVIILFISIVIYQTVYAVIVSYYPLNV